MRKPLRVFNIFGGKKEKSENGDEAPSKVRQAFSFCIPIFSVVLCCFAVYVAPNYFVREYFLSFVLFCLFYSDMRIIEPGRIGNN